MVLSSTRRSLSSAVKQATSAAHEPADVSHIDEQGPQSTLELALEAWAECQPHGCFLPEESLPQVLPVVASYLSSRDESAGSKATTALFAQEGEGPPLFTQMLKVRGGRVQFLHFWHAISKAVQLSADPSDAGVACEEGLTLEGLTLELETLRDGILRLVEASGQEVIPASKLVEAVRVAAAMSETPAFWRTVETAMGNYNRRSKLDMEELTIMILQWLHSAISWQHSTSHLSPTCSSSQDQDSEVTQEAAIRPDSKGKGMAVLLNVYDVSQEDSVHRLNKWLAHKNSPLKFGGIFHAGVEVNGLEWSFGMSLCESMTGVSCCEPRAHSAHRFRQTIRLRGTHLSGEDIADLISQLIEEYPGDDYDLLRRNCCNFADDFAQRLGAGRIPRWVHRLARVGARVDSLMQAVSGRRFLNAEDSEEEEDGG